MKKKFLTHKRQVAGIIAGVLILAMIIGAAAPFFGAWN
jgi:hypothetical protein